MIPAWPPMTGQFTVVGSKPFVKKIVTKRFNTNNGNCYYLEFSNEGVGTNDIEGGNAENSVGIVDAGLLENFTGNGDGAVDLF